MSAIEDESKPAINDHGPSRIPVYLGIAFEAGLVLLAWPLGWLLGTSPYATLHWTISGLLLGLLATLPMVTGFFLLLQASHPSIQRIRQIFNDIVIPFLGACKWFELAVLSLMAGIGEEMLFRGVAQGALDNLLGPWLGLALASVLFGLLHALTARLCHPGIAGGGLPWGSLAGDGQSPCSHRSPQLVRLHRLKLPTSRCQKAWRFAWCRCADHREMIERGAARTDLDPPCIRVGQASQPQSEPGPRAH
jgi:hypothetical protein